MVIINSATGKKYPEESPWGKEAYWIERLQDIWRRKGIKCLVPEIEKVFIGNASYPVNEMHFVDGILYDELNSPEWSVAENDKNISKIMMYYKIEEKNLLIQREIN